ncbi:conserved protein of unknown function [Limnospira indica PCC 8005]|uniref:Uncharacterized protein n=1 Tax=Limnospira indica PCC 8005 TaxID=376219 RepID=A0A9P1P112_9CYAN|nr:conserved protein of unknown function [Limnospira indica PCC 8005]
MGVAPGSYSMAFMLFLAARGGSPACRFPHVGGSIGVKALFSRFTYLQPELIPCGKCCG